MRISRVLSLLMGLSCIVLAVATGWPELIAYSFVGLAFSLCLIWWADQVASSTSNLLGVSWLASTEGWVRFVGWFTLAGYVAFFVVVIVPWVFSRE